MTLTEKLKRLLENPLINCDAHEDCCSCPLYGYIKISIPMGDMESIKDKGKFSGNMPMGELIISISPCMMIAEIIAKLRIDKKPGPDIKAGENDDRPLAQAIIKIFSAIVSEALKKGEITPDNDTILVYEINIGPDQDK